jgi:hypothetical protein
MRELVQAEHARNATIVPKARSQPTQASWDYAKVPRQFDWTRIIEDCVQHLPALPSGLPGFQRVKVNDITENLGPQELFPEFLWMDEL